MFTKPKGTHAIHPSLEVEDFGISDVSKEQLEIHLGNKKQFQAFDGITLCCGKHSISIRGVFGVAIVGLVVVSVCYLYLVLA